MSPNIDSAILKALSLDATKTKISSDGGSGFSSTSELTSIVDGKEKSFFVKTGKGEESGIMFTGEHASLNAIHAIVPSFCPQSYAHGPLSDSNGAFLVTDFINFSSASSSKSKADSGLSFAQKLAKLHNVPAPIPSGHSLPGFGFPFPTCCGNTQQDNSFKTSWVDFYAENRLRHVLKTAEGRHGVDGKLAKLLNRTADYVVPRLLRDGHLKSSGGGRILPVVVHGDLWSGNHGRGIIGDGGVEEVVFDPSCSWSHSEFEFGIMRMFGGGGREFEQEYHKIKGKDEPVEEYEERVLLYELYHHLNHYSIFGGGYKGGAVRIMEGLIEKYAAEG